MTGDGTLPVAGMIGTGSMGGEIAERIRAAGYPLLVHDIRPEATRELAAREGAAVSPDPETLAAGSDIVVLSLPSHVEVGEVVFGPRGVLLGLRPGKLLVNLTTGSVSQLPALAGTEETHGIHYLTAPVSQGVDAARRGELSAFVGGTEEGYRLALPLLGTFASDLLYLGGHRAAMTAKLVTNLSWCVNARLLPKLMAMCVLGGIDLQNVQTVLTRSCGDNWVARHDLGSILNGSYDRTFTAGHVVKDLNLIAELAGLLGVPNEEGAAALEEFGRAALRFGRDAPELILARFIEEETGVRLGAEPPVSLTGTWPADEAGHSPAVPARL